MASFCKVMVDHHHFTSKLQIPPEFVNRYGEILESSKMMTLTITEDGEYSGKVWKVGTQKMGNMMFFTKGWTKFAKEVNLQPLDFVIFKLVDEESAFHVTAYDKTGCIKAFSTVDDEPKNGEMAHGIRWTFSKEVKDYHLKSQKMDMPKGFAVGTGIVKKRGITVEDEKGRKWGVKVCVTNGSTYGMSSGWNKFAVANHAIVGSIIEYRFVAPADLIRARVINNNQVREEEEEEENFNQIK